MALQPGERLGPYELRSLAGAGAMGEVYRARDSRLGRDVALKILSARLSADHDAIARFALEARAVAALNHPAIVALYDVGERDGAAYLVTELLDGETLRERLQRGPVPLPKALDYVRQIAGAIGAAHDRSIVHRDLIVRAGSTVSDPGARNLDTGEMLKTEILTGDAIARAGIQIGQPVTAATEVVVIWFPPVKEGQSARLRIEETYTDPGRYGVVGDELVWNRSFGRPSNEMVLPDG